MNTSLIIIGALNTDIIATGLKRFPKPGELLRGKELVIGPGGKSRNIAAMAATLTGPDKVAMIGRTTQDKHGLWKPPLDALHEVGVNTDFVVIDEKSDKLPAVAIIPVDEHGNNQIILLPGISDDFSKEDVDDADDLFKEAAGDNGYLALTLECPFETAVYAVQKAKACGLKVVLDPGGIEEGMELDPLLADVFLVKPNEHEAKLLTDIKVSDFGSARQAAQKFMQMGVENVLITAGVNGAYLFTPDSEKHIPIPQVPESATKDETGCGDQTMATLCAYLQAGKSLEEAAEIAVLSGTLQFHKRGIQPITREEIAAV